MKDTPIAVKIYSSMEELVTSTEMVLSNTAIVFDLKYQFKHVVIYNILAYSNNVMLLFRFFLKKYDEFETHIKTFA